MGMLPVKFRLVQIISEQSGISNEEIFRIVKHEYPHDRHVTQQGIDQYLMSLKAVGIIEPVNVEIASSGTLLQYYTITKAGISKLKYIDRPSTGREASVSG